MIIVVGATPGSSTGTGDKLARLMGTTPLDLMRNIVWIDLWTHPGDDGELYARFIERSSMPGDVVLLLGRRVARAFRLDHLKALQAIKRDAGFWPEIILVPHPSGRNRWYNDPDHEEDAAIVLRVAWARRGGKA